MIDNYQCTRCGVIISADPQLTPTVQCNACSTVLTLGASGSPAVQDFTDFQGMMVYQCPSCGATIAADPRSTPEVQCNDCSTIIKLGHDLPNAPNNNPLPPPGQFPSPQSSPLIALDLGSGDYQEEDAYTPTWKKNVMQPRVLSISLVLAPVLVTVIISAISTFIRSITEIISGEGELITQGGGIVLGAFSLWAMYILVLTFFYADRNWLTDLGLMVIIVGACIILFNTVTSFPSNILAITAHLFYGYTAICAGLLAIRLMAPYKGIGNVRYNETR